MLASGYDFLRTTQPFHRWKLPEAEEVGFHVFRALHSADCEMVKGTPIIRVSEKRNGHTATLLATIAHEMIHIRQFMLGDTGNHNALFLKLADRVCQIHGFDPKTF